MAAYRNGPLKIVLVNPGWDYVPGATSLESIQIMKRKLPTISAPIAKQYVSDLVNSNIFKQFVNNPKESEYPVAVLDEILKGIMDSVQPVVLLSKKTIKSHKAKHKEIGAEDYALAQRIIDEGELYEQGPGRVIALWKKDNKIYRAALKRTGDREKNYWLTLFLTNEELATIQVRNKFKRIR